MNLQDVIRFCNGHLQTVAIMHEGTLDEMMQLSPEFITTIPRRFGLLDMLDNWAEGYVIRPKIEMRTPVGRLLTKIKGSKFQEKTKKPIVISDLTKKLTMEDLELMARYIQYITIARFDSVLSKLLDKDKLNVKKIVGLTIQDMYIDVEKDYPKPSKDEDEGEAIRDFIKLKKSVYPVLHNHVLTKYIEYTNSLEDEKI